MIDTHCHIDLYPNPLNIVQESERLGIITIGVTNLPSHFEKGYPHVTSCRKVRLALGMHPLHADDHKREFNIFKKNLHRTSYVGEVGLDFSRDGLKTKQLQEDSFDRILNELKGANKLLSIHSRRAEKEVLNQLIKYQIKAAIFHWYSGPMNLMEEIIGAGYYFSINPAMIISENGRKIINKVPANRLLTESDGPFIEHKGMPVKPSDIVLVQKYLSSLWGVPLIEVSNQIRTNFNALISFLK